MTQPTQSRHPGRAVYRTIVAVGTAALGLLPLLPFIAEELGLTTVGWVATVLVVTGGITRVLAMPAVEEWLHKHLPDLAAQPANSADDIPTEWVEPAVAVPDQPGEQYYPAPPNFS